MVWWVGDVIIPTTQIMLLHDCLFLSIIGGPVLLFIKNVWPHHSRNVFDDKILKLMFNILFV